MWTSNQQQNTANQDWVSTPCPLRYGEVPNFSHTLLLFRGTLPPTQGGWVCHLKEFDQSFKSLGSATQPTVAPVAKITIRYPQVREGFTKSMPKSNPHFKESLLPQLWGSQVCFIYRHFEKPSALIMHDIISPYKSPFVQKALYVGLRRATRPISSWWFFSTHLQKSSWSK